MANIASRPDHGRRVTFRRLASALLLVGAADSLAYEVRVDTVSILPIGPLQTAKCHTGLTPPAVAFGTRTCAGAATGTDPFVSYSDAQVSASADLRSGELKLAAGQAGSGMVSFTDILFLDLPGLGPSDTVTIALDVSVDGTYARAPGQDRGQANFSFGAVSGLNGPVNTDNVGGTALYRTDSGSDLVNSTASPEEFSLANVIGDWIQLATDRFRAEIDISGADPTLTFSMDLSAIGPANFANTATLRLSLGPGASFTSDSGVFLSALAPGVQQVEAPDTVLLLGIGLAVIACRRRRRAGCAPPRAGQVFATA